jgi:hypothetical protein
MTIAIERIIAIIKIQMCIVALFASSNSCTYTHTHTHSHTFTHIHTHILTKCISTTLEGNKLNICKYSALVRSMSLERQAETKAGTLTGILVMSPAEK